MFEIVMAGGIVMVPIILCSILAVAITLERLWTLREQRVVPTELTDKVWQWVENRALSDKQVLALQQHSPLGSVLAAGLANRHRDRSVMIQAIEDAGRHVVHDLERFLNTLGTIAAISPLLGLLGTVTGMMRTFKAITVAGIGNPAAMAGGIAEALITTAAGLLVAIPALVAYRYLRGRVDALVIQMEKESIKLVQAIDRSSGTDPGAVAGRRGVNFQPRRTEEPDLNMTSLIDVVLLLLIFFMLSTRFIDEGRLQLRLPEAGVEPEAVQRDAVEIEVTAEGGYRVNGRALINNSPQTLAAAIGKSAGQQPRHSGNHPCRCPRHAPERGDRDGRGRAGGLPADQHRHGQRWARRPIGGPNSRCHPGRWRPIAGCSATCVRICGCSWWACSA